MLARSALTSILLQLAGSSENSTYQAVLEAVCFRLGQGCGRSREAAVLISAGDAKSASCCLVQLLLAAFDTVCSAVSCASLPFANKLSCSFMSAIGRHISLQRTLAVFC